MSLYLAPGERPRTGILTATARFADPGDVLILQVRSGTTWYSLREQVLGLDDQASFTVLIPLSRDRVYRVVLPPTAAHGAPASGQVRVAPW